MYFIYQLLLILLVYPALVLLLLYVLFTGNHRKGIRQRLTLYTPLKKKQKYQKRIWIHAASIGEVQAASLLIDELRKDGARAEIVLTTMTIHGREFAEKSLTGVTCLLAPLDLPLLVGRAASSIDPDIYVCLETELWPLLLRRLRKRDVAVILANGRMSSKTVATYKKYSWFFKGVLKNFSHICLISERDRDRFVGAGVLQDKVEVTGNIKFDRYLPGDTDSIRDYYLKHLGIKEGQEVLVAGSTHEDEEEQLLSAFAQLDRDKDMLLVVAPRHLDRISSIVAMFGRHNYQADMFSTLKEGANRNHRLVLIDTFGDLSRLYSIATYVFCGGSLVDRRGHNIMEPALWGKPVFYGPSMDDFQDGVELLEKSGGGFTVADVMDLVKMILRFRQRPEEYRQACERAGITARAQQGAAKRQGDVVRRYLR